VALVARLGLCLARLSPRLLVADVALGDIDLHFPWQAWHLWHWTGSGGALGSPFGAVVAAAVGMAGVALGDIHLHFAWQACGLALVARLGLRLAPLSPQLLAWQVRHLVTLTVALRGRPGAW